MNWMLIIVVIIFLICILRGWIRGLLRLLFSLVSIVVLIGLISWATPYISNFFKNYTGIYDWIEERCAQRTGGLLGIGLQLFSGSSSSTMADWILKGMSFLIALIVAWIIVRLIFRLLGLVNRVPVVKGINRALGLVGGAVEGYILVCLLFLFVSLISGTVFGETMVQNIESNPFLLFLYDSNILLRLNLFQ
ncbi:MAG: CvpA family protein [Lachnospiraceae bacterium]|nr:CvpA family protein [Lachnospiraceae bacterium]